MRKRNFNNVSCFKQFLHNCDENATPPLLITQAITFISLYRISRCVNRRYSFAMDQVQPTEQDDNEVEFLCEIRHTTTSDGTRMTCTYFPVENGVRNVVIHVDVMVEE